MKGERVDVKIYADHRESQNSRVVALLKKQCSVKEKQLKVGDYILSDHVGCERKTCNDFVKSITDRRLFSQMENMKNSFEKPLLIIEGTDLFTNNGVHPEAIRGALASVAVDYQIPIIWTETQADTARQLYMIAKREQLDMKKGISIRGKRKNMTKSEAQEFLISGLPNINKEKSRRLLKKFGSPERVFRASEGELKEADGIGDELAKQIRSLLKRKYR